MNEIQVRNHQRACPIHTPSLTRVARHLLEHELRLPNYALGLHLISLPGISKLNRQWLNHDGPTDVISFDHRSLDPTLNLYGEIFLCPQQARIQARRFRVPWTLELTRLLVHGILHLQDCDDLTPHDRARMKQRENQILRRVRRAIDLPRISGEPSTRS